MDTESAELCGIPGGDDEMLTKGEFNRLVSQVKFYHYRPQQKALKDLATMLERHHGVLQQHMIQPWLMLGCNPRGSSAPPKLSAKLDFILTLPLLRRQSRQAISLPLSVKLLALYLVGFLDRGRNVLIALFRRLDMVPSPIQDDAYEDHVNHPQYVRAAYADFLVARLQFKFVRLSHIFTHRTPAILSDLIR